MDCLALAQEIRDGRRLTREDPLGELVTADLEDLKIGLCASLGFLTSEQLRRLHKAGVTHIHNNIETSRRL